MKTIRNLGYQYSEKTNENKKHLQGENLGLYGFTHWQVKMLWLTSPLVTVMKRLGLDKNEVVPFMWYAGCLTDNPQATNVFAPSIKDYIRLYYRQAGGIGLSVQLS